MPAQKTNLRVCKNGHQYYKSTDCPVCPVCENARKPKESFLSMLGAPARRALENKGIATLQKLSEYNETQILQLHGIGKTSIPKLKLALQKEGLSFAK